MLDVEQSPVAFLQVDTQADTRVYFCETRFIDVTKTLQSPP